MIPYSNVSRGEHLGASDKPIRVRLEVGLETLQKQKVGKKVFFNTSF